MFDRSEFLGTAALGAAFLAPLVAKLKPANDLNVARTLAGTADMFDGAAGLGVRGTQY